MTENINRLNVDAAVSDLVNIFQHAGEPMKCKLNSSKRIHNNSKRRKPHANWWDCECQEAKEIKISKLRGYRSSRSEQDFAVYLEAKKHFKRRTMCRKNLLILIAHSLKIYEKQRSAPTQCGHVMKFKEIK